MSPTAGLDALGETNWKSQRGIEPRLYCTVPYRTVLYCTVLYCAVLYCTVLYCTVLYCTVLYCIVLYCTVLYCTVLYCTVLCCTVLYCTVLYSGLQHRHCINWATQSSVLTKWTAVPVPVHAVIVYEGICLQLHSSVTLASRSGRFTAGEKSPGTYWVGSWVGPHPVWTYWRKEKFPAPAGIRIRVIQTVNQLSCSKFHITVEN